MKQIQNREQQLIKNNTDFKIQITMKTYVCQTSLRLHLNNNKLCKKITKYQNMNLKLHQNNNMKSL